MRRLIRGCLDYGICDSRVSVLYDKVSTGKCHLGARWACTPAKGASQTLGWEQSDLKFVPAEAGMACRLLEKRRAAAKPGLTGRSADWDAGQG